MIRNGKSVNSLLQKSLIDGDWSEQFQQVTDGTFCSVQVRADQNFLWNTVMLRNHHVSHTVEIKHKDT